MESGPLSVQNSGESAPPAARVGAGVGLVLVAAGTGAGFWLGGPIGAGAGILLVGAARNAVRASRDWRDPDPVMRADAGANAGLALLGGVVGGILAYRAYFRSEKE